MFRKLRNRFVLTTMIMSTAILVIAFVSIFTFVSIGSNREKPRAPKEFEDSSKMAKLFEKEIELERESQLGRLAITLICVGLSVEVLVFIASYYFAEKSIAPVKDAYEKQKIFIANASHELKTPIAAVQANFEALGATEQPWVDNIDTELARASKLVNDLLFLARTDGRTEQATKKNVDIEKIIRKRAQLIEARIGEKKLEISVPEKKMVYIAEADFTQILDILLDNAAKYSKKYIKISASEQGLVVENDGKTIPKEKLNKLFDRFYQADKTKEGSGLGLAIAKSIAEQNGWNIRAESENNTTRFVLSF